MLLRRRSRGDGDILPNPVSLQALGGGPPPAGGPGGGRGGRPRIVEENPWETQLPPEDAARWAGIVGRDEQLLAAGGGGQRREPLSQAYLCGRAGVERRGAGAPGGAGNAAA